MKIIIDTKENLNTMIANEYISLIKHKPNAILGLATGSSPLGVYAKMVKAYEDGVISYKDVTTFNLDEYIGLDGNHDQSYRYFMNTNLFDHIDINKSNTNVPNGIDYNDSIANYDNNIAKAGGIDLQILGIGSDGHIAFNEPDTSFDSLTHMTDLTKQTIKDNARFFNDIKDVPTKAITMGLKSIMNAKKIVLIATGSNKAEAIYHLVNDKPNEAWPCTILKDHPDCTIYIDDEAASKIK